MAATDEERRKTIVEQHVHLRRTILWARQTAQDNVGNKVLTDELKTAAIRLQREVLTHLADEEEMLDRFLCSRAQESVVQSSLLRAEHAHQRAVLAMLTGAGKWPPPGAVATRMLALCDHLLADMEFEERELLPRALTTADPTAAKP
jgi:hypothetical protein